MLLRADEDNDDVIESFSLYYIFSVFPSFVYYYNVRKSGHISAEEYRRLYPNGSHIGVTYGLPKVHKNGCPMRPVCSAVGTSTYQLSKFVSNIIKPAAGNVNRTDLNDTFQFV